MSDAVFMVVAGETIDPKRMGEYSAALAATGLYPANGGYYLNAPQPIEVFEGAPSPDFAMLIVRFPSIDAARTFWNSDAYQQKVKPLRQNPSAGDYTVMVFAEADLPAYMAGRVASADYL